MAYLYSPPLSWAVIDDCGNFPCTGPSNALIRIDGAQFTGTLQPEQTYNEFQIAPNNVNFMPSIADCTFKDEWNSYYC